MVRYCAQAHLGHATKNTLLAPSTCLDDDTWKKIVETGKRDVHNEAHPHHRLGLLKLDLVAVESGPCRHEDASPSQS